MSQSRGLGSDTLEDVVHEGVHDRHGLAADSGVRVHLLQHFVDVDRVRLPPPLPAFLVPSTLGFGLAGGLFGSFGCGGFGRHVDSLKVQQRMTRKTMLADFIYRADVSSVKCEKNDIYRRN